MAFRPVCNPWPVDEVTWGALTLTLTLIGGIWTWLAFRRRGLASGLRGAGFTLLPAAAWLTGTMEMFTEIGGSVVDWATHLVFSPVVWAGVVLTGLSVLLLGISGALQARGVGVKGSRPASVTDRGAGPGLGRGSGRAAPPLDDDMADIEAILRKRGIT